MNTTQQKFRRILKRKAITPKHAAKICDIDHYKMVHILDKRTEPLPLVKLIVYLFEDTPDPDSHHKTYDKVKELLKDDNTQLTDLMYIKTFVDNLLIE